MSARLVNAIPESYANAKDFKTLFAKGEQDVIQLTHEPREQPKLGIPGESCKTELFFGFFFDGTRNNYRKDEGPGTLSNIGRLYDCYPGQSVPGVLPAKTNWSHKPDRYTHFFRVYVPGVGTEFNEVGDAGKGMQATMGAAIGHLGGARVVWALLQAINNVHRYFLKEPLVGNAEAKRLANEIDLDYRKLRETRPGKFWEDFLRHKDAKELATRKSFEELLQRLHRAVTPHWYDDLLGRPKKIDPGIVKRINISIFGFSRGATEARAFANWLVALCKLDALLRGKGETMTLGGFPVQFDFLGLLDTVASVGGANTFGNQWGLGFVDGHGEWSDAEVSLRIPERIKTLHLVAAHEIRRSFPLDSVAIRDSLPESAEEIVFPGVHSDLGGGYAPREQGKGIDGSGADMLSRIPLIYMYRAARLSGVPLKLELADPDVKARFQLAPSTVQAFNAYLAACKVKSGLTEIMREQRRLYILWRYQRRVTAGLPLDQTESFKRASNFDKNDLHSANLEFENEIKEFESWLEKKGNHYIPRQQKAGFDNSRENEWEEIATWWSNAPTLPPGIAEFFDEYVHDSRAWFKLIPGNPDSEEDTKAQLAEWVQRRRNAAQLQRRNPRITDGLTAEQRRAADEFSRTGEIPRMNTEGREPYFSAKAGYLRFRKVYAGGDSILVSDAGSISDSFPKVA